MSMQLKTVLGRDFIPARVRAFADWPELVGIASRFIHFVSPILYVNGRNLASDTLNNAINAYDEAIKEQDAKAGYGKFIEQLAVSAKELSNVRISVQDELGLWLIWTYDIPLSRLMARYGRRVVRIRKRDDIESVGPTFIKLMANIISTQELALANLNYGELVKALH